MTADEQQALHDAAAQVAQDAGLSNIARSDWTLAQRKDYLDRFVALVKANPDQFAPETIATVGAINTTDFYYDYSANADLAVANAVLSAASYVSAPTSVANGLIDAINGAGSGLSNLGKLLPFLVPVSLLLIVVFATKSGAKKAESLVSF